MKNQQHTRVLLGAIAALGLSAPSAFAVAYTLTPGVGAQDWNTAATWGGSGTPGGAVGDTATVSGDFGGVAQTVNISANLTNAITSLTLGDTNATPAASTVTASSGSSLSFGASGAFIKSTGTAGAVNTINAPISLAGGIVFGESAAPAAAVSNDLIINGKITPTAAANRNIENSSVKTVTLGDIDISTGNTTATLTIRSGTTGVFSVGSNFILNGTIANGSSVAAGLTLGARSGNATIAGAPGTNFTSIQINGNNTYTGATILGVQANVNTVFKINSDNPFGPSANSALTIGAGSAQNTLEAMNSDRTITRNSILINRPIAFQGNNSITLAAPTKIDLSNNPATGLAFITNNITAAGKTVTIGSANSSMNLNTANSSDLYRVKDVTGAGTTIIESNIVDNSGVVPAASRIGVFMRGTGNLILTGNNTFQGGLRITGNGTVQLGNGGTTGSFNPGNSLTPIVNGTASGTLAFNRSDAVSTTLTSNGPIGLFQKGSGTVTLTNTQFNSGSNVVGDGTVASKLIVSGAVVSGGSTSASASVIQTTNSQLITNTITLGGSDTTTGLGLKVGQPVYVTGTPSSVLYIDTIVSATQFTAFGGTLLTGGAQSLSFGAGSALGTSAATTTVNNLGTLAGTGTIAGSVNALAGSFLAPGAVDGAAGTLSTGALSLTGATLRFDLASTAAGVSDSITSSGAVAFSALTFDFNAITAGVLDTSAAYNLVTSSSGFTGSASQITTAFSGGLTGLNANYTIDGNVLSVAFSAIPEPSSFAAFAGMAALGGCLVRRRRKAQA